MCSGCGDVECVAVVEDLVVGGGDPVALAGFCAADADYRLRQVARRGGTVEVRVAERENATVRADQPVAVTRRRSGRADDRASEAKIPCRSVETRVSKREYTAVGCHQPIAGMVAIRDDG